jgi:hypothetical protein
MESYATAKNVPGESKRPAHGGEQLSASRPTIRLPSKRGEAAMVQPSFFERSSADTAYVWPIRGTFSLVQDAEVIAQELSALGHKLDELEKRMAAVEKVNRRLEEAALTTARALGEISGHWDAVYEAMRGKDESQEAAKH